LGVRGPGVTRLHTARKHKLIDENPFCEVTIPIANVSARQRFIDRDAIQKLLNVACRTVRLFFGDLLKSPGTEVVHRKRRRGGDDCFPVRHDAGY
jgi:hypothetical protein